MDYNLSKYEIIHETLSSSESENEADGTNDENNTINKSKKISERKRVIRNFIICQPSGDSKEKDDNYETKNKDWTASVNSIGAGGPSVNAVNKVIAQTVCKVLHEEFPTKLNDIDAVKETSKKCPYCKFATLSRFSFRKHVALHENKLHLVFTQGIFPTSDTPQPKERKQSQCPNYSDFFRNETALQLHRNCESYDKFLPCAVNERNDNLPLNKDIVADNFLRENYLKPLLDMESRKTEVSHNVPPSQNISENLLVNKNLRNGRNCEVKQLIDQNTEISHVKLNNKLKNKDSLHPANYLLKILACDVKEEVLDPGYNNQSDEEVSNEEHHEIILENIKKEEHFENSGNETSNPEEIVGNSYDDLERTMAILTGQEENNNSNTNSQEIMNISTSNPSYTQQPIGSDDFSVEIKLHELNEKSRSFQPPSVAETNVVVSDAPEKNISNSKAVEVDKVFIGGISPIEVHFIVEHANPTLKELRESWRKSIEYFKELKEKESIDEKSYVITLIKKWNKSYKRAFPTSVSRCRIPGGVPCPDCDSSYGAFHFLERHWRRIHDSNAPVIHCPHCLYKTNQRELFRSHLNYKHGAHNNGNRKVYSCDVCDKSYFRSTSLKMHKIKNHIDQAELPLLKCTSCSYATVDNKNLSKHKVRHLFKDGYLCLYCGLKVKCEATLIKHELMHEENSCAAHKCKYCNERFNHKLDLYSHKEIFHSKTPKHFKCKFCEFFTLHKALLVVHENINHRNIKEFKCSECPLFLKDLEGFEQHINRNHNPYLTWKYCAHCSYKSLFKARIASHAVVHLPIKKAPIKCKLCKYRTYKTDYYARHFKNKHNPNATKYQCYHCGFVTKIKAKMHQHMQEKGHLLTG